MRTRASLAISLFIFVATAALGGCHHAAGKIMADTALLPYQKPDIDDITGIDPDDAPPDAAAPAATPPAGAPPASSGGK
jgi:hypothetical protein